MQSHKQIDQARHGPLLVLDPNQIDPSPRNPRHVFGEPEINALPSPSKPTASYNRSWYGETVAALDDLAEMAGQMGLRAAARLINTAPSWLSERLNVCSDPVVFPALEAGRLSLGQATELRRAPAHARRTLLDRLLRNKPNTDLLRTWVREIKDADRRSRAENVAALAVASDRNMTRSERPYRALLQQLHALGAPSTRAERQALQELGQLVQQLLADAPRDSRREHAPKAAASRNQRTTSEERQQRLSHS